LIADNIRRAVGGEGIPESYLPKTCVHQWEGHTKVEPFGVFILVILVIVYFRVSTAFDGYPSGVICCSVPLSTTLSRFGMCMTPSIVAHALVSFFLKAVIDRVLPEFTVLLGIHTESVCALTMATLRCNTAQLTCIVFFSF
jgi:hypothetical protein